MRKCSSQICRQSLGPECYQIHVTNAKMKKSIYFFSRNRIRTVGRAFGRTSGRRPCRQRGKKNAGGPGDGSPLAKPVKGGVWRGFARPRPLNGRSSHLIEAAKRGRLDQMIFFSAALTTRAPPGLPAERPARRPLTTRVPPPTLLTKKEDIVLMITLELRVKGNAWGRNGRLAVNGNLFTWKLEPTRSAMGFWKLKTNVWKPFA